MTSERERFEEWVREEWQPESPDIFLEWSHGGYAIGTAHLMLKAFKAGDQARADLAEQREAELVELLRRARWALHVWESQDYDVQSRLSLQNEAADLRCEIASRLESYKAEGRENDNDER